VEARLAHGEPLPAIVADVRKRYEDCPADLPSDRTFRRWRAEFFDQQRRDQPRERPNASLGGPVRGRRRPSR
jgi:hypothetical protein